MSIVASNGNENGKSMPRPKNILVVGEIIHIWYKTYRNFQVQHLFDWGDRNLDQMRYIIRRSLEVYYCAFRDAASRATSEKRGRKKSFLTDEQEESICIAFNAESLENKSFNLKFSVRFKRHASRFVPATSWVGHDLQNFKKRNEFDGDTCMFMKVFAVKKTMSCSADLSLSICGAIEMLPYNPLIGQTEPDALWAANLEEQMVLKKKRKIEAKENRTIDEIVEGVRFGKILATLAADNVLVFNANVSTTTCSMNTVLLDSNQTHTASSDLLHDTNPITIANCVNSPQNERFLSGGTFYQTPLTTVRISVLIYGFACTYSYNIGFNGSVIVRYQLIWRLWPHTPFFRQ